ncbi:MAG: response regulator [Pseudomonadota bacterium]
MINDVASTGRMELMKLSVVVMDSPIIGEIAVRLLKSVGVTARLVENAAEAVAACREKSVDVVFLDWDLPSMGALDFLRGLGGDENRPRIILCVTENDPQQYVLAQAAGADAQLLKPFDKAALLTALQDVGVQSADAPADEPVAINR